MSYNASILFDLNGLTGTISGLTLKYALVTKNTGNSGFTIDTTFRDLATDEFNSAAVYIPRSQATLDGFSGFLVPYVGTLGVASDFSGVTVYKCFITLAPQETENADVKSSTLAVPGSAMTLTSGERTSIGTAVWASTTRTLTSLAAIAADIAGAVWNAVATSYNTALSMGAKLNTAAGGGGGSSTIVISAATGTVSSGEVEASKLIAYQGAAPSYVFSILDSNGNPIDLSGKSIRFNAFKPADSSIAFFTVAGTVGGTSNNQVTITLTSTNTADPESLEYVLWNTTDKAVLARGTFEIQSVPFDAAP